MCKIKSKCDLIPVLGALLFCFLDLNKRMDAISKNIQIHRSGLMCTNTYIMWMRMALLTLKENERIHVFIQKMALCTLRQMENINVCLYN